MKNARLSSKFENLSPYRICETHFTLDSYECDKVNKMLGRPIRKILKKSAIPTLNLPNKNSPLTIMPNDVQPSKLMKKEVLTEEKPSILDERYNLINFAVLIRGPSCKKKL